MASSLFLKNKLFSELFIDVDTAVGMAENMFYYSNFPTEYTSTKSLMKYPRKGLPPFFFMNEDPYMPIDKRFILPAWGSRETKTIQQNGYSFKITQNANEGYVGSTMSIEDGSLREEVLLVGVSTQKVTTQVCYILGNFEDYSITFYSDSTSWLLDAPLMVLDSPERNNEGLIELEYEIKFKCFVLTIKSLTQGERMPKVNLLRFSSIYELSGEEIQNFSFTQEVKGEGFATGLAIKTCEFSFTDTQGVFDKQNPSSPFYGIDLRNFIMTPRVDYFTDGTFEEIEASYPLGSFYGDPLEESGNDYTAKMKGTTLLGKVKDLKTNRHYYTLTNLKEVLEDLFLDVGVTVYVEEALINEVFLYQFYGGDKLESVLKPLLEKYRLVVAETTNNQINILTLDNSSIREPRGFYDLSNSFKYQAGSVDKVINKLTVKYVQNTLSDEGLERYWTKALLPAFDTEGEIRRKLVNIEMDNTTQEVEVLTITQNLLELPKLVNTKETKDKIYSARNPNVPQPEPTLNYQVLLEETFNQNQETYISEIILSKNNSTDSQPSYLEFEWWAEDCFYLGSPATLVTVDV